MRPPVDELEYRGFLGLDTRQDETLVPRNYQIKAENVILQQGVFLSKPGNEQWGNLDHSAELGILRQMKSFDVGDEEYIIMHKGTKIYFGTKFDSTYTVIQDLNGSDWVMNDEESEFEANGINRDAAGIVYFKVLVRQKSGCTVLEFNGSTNTWIARNPGISTDGVRITASTIAGNAEPGEYRVRVVARRVVNGVRFNESAPIGKSGSTDDIFYQQITLVAGQAVQVTVTDSSPDDQVTEYGVQITRVLKLVTDTDFSNNNNDPTIFFENLTIPSASLGVATTVPTDKEDYGATTPNLIGHRPIPGHIIGKISGNLNFFGGVAGNQSRIFRSGDSGYFYHSELYDPHTFYAAGDDDGQELVGLGVAQDHLIVFKEAKTGIVANRDPAGLVVWRDEALGIKHRKAFANVSEDEIIVLNQDGIFRLFNGIRYDRERSISDVIYGYSENIRTTSENIDPRTLTYVYHKERMHILHGVQGERTILVFHPRDQYGWTRWNETGMNITFKANNSQTWLFERNGKLYEQDPESGVKTDNGNDVIWDLEFALLTSPSSKKNKVLLKMCGVDGSFNSDLFASFDLDFGRIITAFTEAFPDASDPANANNPWFQLNSGDDFLVGNYIKLRLRGSGDATIRGIFWGSIDKKSGNLGWSQDVFDPNDYVLNQYIIIDAENENRNENLMIEYDAGDDTRNELEYIEFDREGI